MQYSFIHSVILHLHSIDLVKITVTCGYRNHHTWFLGLNLTLKKSTFMYRTIERVHELINWKSKVLVENACIPYSAVNVLVIFQLKVLFDRVEGV